MEASFLSSLIQSVMVVKLPLFKLRLLCKLPVSIPWHCRRVPEYLLFLVRFSERFLVSIFLVWKWSHDKPFKMDETVPGAILWNQFTSTWCNGNNLLIMNLQTTLLVKILLHDILSLKVFTFQDVPIIGWKVNFELKKNKKKQSRVQRTFHDS